LLAALVGATWLVYNHYTDAERLRKLAEDYLQQHVTGKVHVRGASFSWRDGLELFDVSIDEPPPPPGERRPNTPVFSCERLTLSHDRWRLLLGELIIRTIMTHAPHCAVVRYANTGRTNLASLFKPIQSLRVDDATTILPTIDFRDARFSVITQEGEEDRLVEDLTLTIRGRPSDTDPLVYSLVWGDPIKMTSGHSQFDLRTTALRDVEGGLPWMSIEAVMIVVDAKYDGAGSWCDLLGLDGQVRADRYHISSPEGDAPRRSASIQLDQTSLSIPINEEEEKLDRSERYLSFDDVNGTIEVTEEELRAEFTGMLHGSRCEVQATLHGGMGEISSLDDVGFEAHLSVTNLRWPRPDPNAPPREVRFIKRWETLQSFYNDYDPHGTADFELSLAKDAGPDQPITVKRALLTPTESSATCRFFPYRFDHVTGQVEYTPQGVEIQSLTGRHDGAVIRMEGHFDKPRLASAAWLHIVADDVPFDQQLYDALASGHQNVWDRLSPEGTVDLDITMRRAASETREACPWRTAIDSSFDDLSFTYDRFPYAVRNLSGSIRIGKDLVEVRNLQSRMEEVAIAIDGTIACQDDQPTEMNLSVVAENVPLNDKLFQALSPSLRESVTPFRPTGRFSANTSLSWDKAAQDIQPIAHVFLEDVTIEHDDIPIRVEGITGTLAIDQEKITLREITGRYGEAVLQADGVHHLSGEGETTALNIDCRGLRIDKNLQDLLHKHVGKPFRAMTIDGAVDAEIAWGEPAESESGSKLHATVELNDATVRHARLPVPFTDVSGRVTLDEDRFHTDQITGRYGEAPIRATIDLQARGDEHEGVISFDALGLPLDQGIREALGHDMREAWDWLKPEGRIDLHVGCLHIGRTGPQEKPICSVDGWIELHGASLRGLGYLTEMHGKLHGKGMLTDRLGGVVLNAGAQFDAAQVFGRRVTGAEAELSYCRDADGTGLFKLQNLQADCHGGTLLVPFVDLEPFLGPDAFQDDQTDETVTTGGWVNGRLSLSGKIGNPQSKRGTGGVEILDARLYRLPIILAILNYLNPTTPPDPEAFDSARALFSIAGQRMEFEDVLLTGPALTFVGSGHLTLSDRYVDLRLKPANGKSRFRVPFLSEMVETAARNIVGLHVSGPLSHPAVRAQSLPGVNRTMRGLFKKKREPSPAPTPPQ
jgi:hypothetical protein